MNRPAPLPASRHCELLDLKPPRGNDVDEVLEGLQAEQKFVSPRFLYDDRGSDLFETITELPEYYPSRTERQILMQHAAEIASVVGTGRLIIEPGAGSCAKIRLLLEALKPAGYWPLDISGEFVHQAAQALRRDHPGLPVTAVCADFNQLEQIQSHLPPADNRLVFYPGSTIGNLDRQTARALLADLSHLMGPEGGLLLGVDLHKSEQVLNDAYNDSRGITAAFNLNLLTHLNRLLPADFREDRFRHQAFYNRQLRRIEMHLESVCDQIVHCAGRPVHFRRGETIHTENSYKYSLPDLDDLLREAGLARDHSWFDPDQLFGFHHCVIQK